MRIIGITGQKQNGKDTIGLELAKSYGFRNKAFGDRLKEACSLIFSVDSELLFGTNDDKETLTKVRWSQLKGVEYPGEKRDPVYLTCRELLQIVATDIFRSKMPNIWVDAMFMEDFDYNLVITDVRFPNEAEKIIEMGGEIWRVIRGEQVEPEHESEKPISSLLVKHEIYNNSTIPELHREVDRLMRNFE